MKSTRVLKTVVFALVCALALVMAVGCSSSTSSGSNSASSSASASSAASSAASDSASSAASSAASESASSASSSAASDSASSAATDASSSSAASAGGQLTPETAAAQGYQVFTGTVRVLNAADLIALQAIDIDPAVVGSGDGTYAVLVFDQATDVTGESADGTGQRTESANMLGIAEHTDYSSFVVEYGDLDACKALDGQHATIAAKAQDIMFPSDVRLPIGEPSASAIVMLG